MSKYAIKFSKEGYLCYISHLDLLRLFKRAFKKADIRLIHSQGYNPHPRLGFAQPLSLGYSSICEFLEVETIDHYPIYEIETNLQKLMPTGIKILCAIELPGDLKSLAATNVEAEYLIGIPVHNGFEKDGDTLCQEFLAQDEIIEQKRQKKTKKMIDMDIKPKIRFLNFLFTDTTLIVTAQLDAGSISNLSPELLISAIAKFLSIDTPRSDIQVMRKKLNFEKKVDNVIWKK
ncbi:MAG: TIGR03936 family radical SAM-associated protein [Anaerovoracaceae bacterium]